MAEVWRNRRRAFDGTEQWGVARIGRYRHLITAGWPIFVAGGLAGQSMRLLLVDDETRLLRVLAELLEACGHSVCTANDPRRALDRVMAQPFDVLVTDYSMPGMDGIELARAAQDRDPRLAVVLMSGLPVPRNRRDPAWGWLSKPFRVEDLLSEARRIRPGRAGASADPPEGRGPSAVRPGSR